MNLTDGKRAVFSERLSQACTAKNGGKKHGSATMLAKKINVSTQAVAGWMKGASIPDESRWPAIAEALDIDLEWLISESHEKQENIEYRNAEVFNVTRAAKISFPLIAKLKPDAEQSVISDIVESAYLMALAGESDEAITGRVVSKLLSEEKQLTKK